VCFVPLPEGSSIDLDNGRPGEGVGADQFVIGGMEGNGDDTDLPRDALRAPREVAGVKAQRAEFAVAATGADKMDALCANTSIGRLTTLLESSNSMLDMVEDAIGLCIPLLAVVCPLRTSRGALVARVSGDTHDCGS